MKKKGIIVSFAIMVLFQICTLNIFASSNVYKQQALISDSIFLGDVNQDGLLNAVDALNVLKIAVDGSSYTKETLFWGDMNSDNIINATDALSILKIKVGVTDFININLLDYKEIATDVAAKSTDKEFSNIINSTEELETWLLKNSSYHLEGVSSLDAEFFKENTLLCIGTYIYSEDGSNIRTNRILNYNNKIMLDLDDFVPCLNVNNKENFLVKVFSVKKSSDNLDIILNYNMKSEYKLFDIPYNSNGYSDGIIIEPITFVVNNEQDLVKFENFIQKNYPSSTDDYVVGLKEYNSDKNTEFFKNKSLVFVFFRYDALNNERIILDSIDSTEDKINAKITTYRESNFSLPGGLLITHILATELDKSFCENKEVNVDVNSIVIEKDIFPTNMKEFFIKGEVSVESKKDILDSDNQRKIILIDSLEKLNDIKDNYLGQTDLQNYFNTIEEKLNTNDYLMISYSCTNSAVKMADFILREVDNKINAIIDLEKAFSIAHTVMIDDVEEVRYEDNAYVVLAELKKGEVDIKKLSE